MEIGPRWLPNLNALKAFEAAARRLNFSKAADELHVTQGAVSHQIKALEGQLGLALFHRRPRGLELTEAGRAYLPVLTEAFGRIAAGTRDLLDRDKAGVLTVSVSPNFAAKWLVGRLGDFAGRNPDIDLRIGASLQHVDFLRDGIDMAVRHGDGNWPGLAVARLCEEEVFPVCSPRLTIGPRALRQPGDLRHHTLLHGPGPIAWTEWLATAGVDGIDANRGLSFNQASLSLDAAVDGQGVALARSALAARDLLAGRLVRPFRLALPAPFAYYVVAPKATATRPKIALFRDWLLAEAAKDAERLKALAPSSPRSAAPVEPAAIR
jgi:LysR family glycine cleavage system transcriptional activator